MLRLEVATGVADARPAELAADPPALLAHRHRPDAEPLRRIRHRGRVLGLARGCEQGELQAERVEDPLNRGDLRERLEGPPPLGVGCTRLRLASIALTHDEECRHVLAVPGHRAGAGAGNAILGPACRRGKRDDDRVRSCPIAVHGAEQLGPGTEPVDLLDVAVVRVAEAPVVCLDTDDPGDVGRVHCVRHRLAPLAQMAAERIRSSASASAARRGVTPSAIARRRTRSVVS